MQDCARGRIQEKSSFDIVADQSGEFLYLLTDIANFYIVEICKVEVEFD